MNTTQQHERKEDFEGQMLCWAGTFFIFSIGVVHLLHAEELFSAAAYLGVLTLVNFLASCAVAVSLSRTGGRGAWALGAAISGGALVLFVISRTFGLPGYEEVVGKWLNFPAWSVISMELAYLALCGAALLRSGDG